jgi:hypothetical protein
LKPRETIELAKRDGHGPFLSRIAGGDCVEIVQAFRRYWAREGAKSGREFAVLVIARILRCDSLVENERSGGTLSAVVRNPQLTLCLSRAQLRRDT